jgi:hypothetical protein
MASGRKTRRVALIGPLARRIAVHTAGYPLDPDHMLPPPDVVLLISESKAPGETMLFRDTAHGELCGDTPHDSVSEAEDQASREYGEALLGWLDVPDDVADAHGFAIQYASDRLNQRDE